MELCDTPLHALHTRRLAKEITTADIAESVLRRVEALEPTLNSYITLSEQTVLPQAQAADAALAKGEPLSPIAGMPLAIKDIFATEGLQTTCGSRILEGFTPPYDATAVAKLRAAGLNLVGKANLDEFAMGSSTENSGYGPTRNPWNTDHVPGGSSGGSASAVAAGQALAALGTDTGGSIRQPAAFCGITGLKPTYGRVSRYGMIAYASSLDQGGPLTHGVQDAALLLNLIAGQDSRDATSSAQPVPDFTVGLEGDLKGRKVGLIKEFQTAEGGDPEVKAAFAENLKTLQALGAEVVEVSVPTIAHTLPVYYILAMSEASSNLGRYDSVRYGPRAEGVTDLQSLYRKSREAFFGTEVKRRIMLGTFALSSGYYDAWYLRAQKLRMMLREDFRKVFEQVDLLANPTSPVPAFKLGERSEDPLSMYLVDVYTLPANLAGLPALSLPAGFTASGLPLGLQLMAKPFQEHALLQGGAAFESATDFHTKRPALQP